MIPNLLVDMPCVKPVCRGGGPRLPWQPFNPGSFQTRESPRMIALESANTLVLFPPPLVQSGMLLGGGLARFA